MCCVASSLRLAARQLLGTLRRKLRLPAPSHWNADEHHWDNRAVLAGRSLALLPV